MIRKVYVGGHCMGPDFTPCVATADDEAEIFAGDFVLAHFRVGDEVYSILKQLETWGGEWYLWARTGVTLLAGHQLVLARIERVTRVTKLPTDSLPSVGTECAASLEDMRIQDEFSREARKAWNEHGFPRGVPFPGLDALYRYRGPEMLLTKDYCTRLRARATIPATNPTTPGEPQTVRIDSINGTLRFSWTRPNVVPIGTVYQVISSVNCANAAVGSLRWEGNALQADIPYNVNDLVTAKFWWMRSIANSYASAYTPNTFGTAAAPTPPAENRTIISDPQFRAGPSIGSYWQTVGGAPVSLSATGGPSDGTGKLIVVGTTAFGGSPWTRDVYCARTANNDPEAACQPGNWFNWTVLARRTSAITSGGGFTLSAVNRYVSGGANVDLNVTAPLVRCDTLTLNTWTAIVGSLQISTLAQYNLVYLNLRFDSSNMGSGTLEISGVDAILR